MGKIFPSFILCPLILNNCYVIFLQLLEDEKNGTHSLEAVVESVTLEMAALKESLELQSEENISLKQKYMELENINDDMKKKLESSSKVEEELNSTIDSWTKVFHCLNFN